MSEAATFRDALDAVESLPPDDQAELIAIVRKRLVERNRRQLQQDVREARAEFAKGGLRPTTVDDLFGEILP